MLWSFLLSETEGCNLAIGQYYITEPFLWATSLKCAGYKIWRESGSFYPHLACLSSVQSTLFVLKKAIQFLQSTSANKTNANYNNNSKQQCVRDNQSACGQEVHTGLSAIQLSAGS